MWPFQQGLGGHNKILGPYMITAPFQVKQLIVSFQHILKKIDITWDWIVCQYFIMHLRKKEKEYFQKPVRTIPIRNIHITIGDKSLL